MVLFNFIPRFGSTLGYIIGLSIYIVLYFSTLTNAQISEELRVEWLFDSDRGNAYSFFPLEERGVLVLHRSDAIKKGNQREHTVYFYDTLLSEKWKNTYFWDNEWDIVDHALDGTSIYLLLQKHGFEYQIQQIELNTGITKQIPYKKMFKAEVTFMEVLAGKLFLGGESEFLPFVLVIDPIEGTQTILPGLQRQDSYLAQMYADSTYQRLITVINGRSSKTKSVFVQSYDTSGLLIKSIQIPNNQQFELLNFKVQSLNAQTFVLMGMYGLRKWDKPQGFYILPISDQKIEDNLRFYDFIYLKNFFVYLPDNRRVEFVEKGLKKKLNGKSTRYSMDVFLNDIRIEGDQFVLSGETYVPIYSTSNSFIRSPYSTYYDPFLRMYTLGTRLSSFYQYDPTLNKVPTSYKYKSAFFCGIDIKTLKPVWDNAFHLDEHKSEYPENFVSFAVSKDSIGVMHYYDNKIYTKREKKEQSLGYELKGVDPFKEQTLSKVLQHDYEKIRYWYGTSFLFFSLQTIRDKTTDDKRKVFVMSKVHISNAESTLINN